VKSPVVVAVSGGLDSCVLFHLLRFPGAGPLELAQPGGADAGEVRLVAAHFDHRMRAGSEDDALWLRGLCAAWGVELVTGRASSPPVSEGEARAARYAFLDQVRHDVGAKRVATAHHADDQAETILFRMFRGTGPEGLRGIRSEREDGVWRPLLGVWRDELLAHARAVGLAWREDPTNTDLGFARNAIRHRVLADAERLVAPGARRGLVRFAERAARDEEGWESLIPTLVRGLAPERGPDGVRFDRDGLLALHPAVRARVLRALLFELDLRPGADVTELAVDFASVAESGRGIDLGGAVRLRRELDRLALVRRRSEPSGPDRSVVIPGPASGSGEGVLAGRSVWVRWGEAATPERGLVERFLPGGLRFPLVVRGWEDGDRIRTASGVRKLKRVFLDARVPAPERRRLPVLADAEGDVLWIPGVARAHPSGGVASGRDALPIGIG
jgi:tRNA(Ile)-lysidine synthase